MNTRIDLFNKDNLSDVSLNHFAIGKQTTVLGFGLAPAEYVTFEMSEFDAPAPPPACTDPCNMPPVTFPEPTMYQLLTCCDGSPITLSAANPVVVLNAPKDLRIRARYHGYAFAGIPLSSRVYAYESEPSDIGAANTGCCGS